MSPKVGWKIATVTTSFNVASMQPSNESRTNVNNVKGFVASKTFVMTRKTVKERKRVCSGIDKTAYWRVQHSDRSISDDITEELLISKFG